MKTPTEIAAIVKGLATGQDDKLVRCAELAFAECEKHHCDTCDLPQETDTKYLEGLREGKRQSENRLRGVCSGAVKRICDCYLFGRRELAKEILKQWWEPLTYCYDCKLPAELVGKLLRETAKVEGLSVVLNTGKANKTDSQEPLDSVTPTADIPTKTMQTSFLVGRKEGIREAERVLKSFFRKKPLAAIYSASEVASFIKDTLNEYSCQIFGKEAEKKK